MADPDKAKLARIAKLDDVERDLLEKLQAVADERAAILRGEAGIGQKLKDLQAAWQAAWGARYAGRIYQFTFIKDVPHMKKWLKTYTVAQISEMFIAYVTTEDDFVARARHPFNLFVTGFNRYVPEGHDVEGLTLTSTGSGCRVPNCLFVPPCRDGAEHTDRIAATMRR